MSFLMPKAPPAPKEVPVPSRTTPQIQQAAAQQQAAMQADMGASNWLTGGLGVDEDKIKSSGVKLLGG